MNKLPPHAVVVSKLPGAPYSSHSIYVEGKLIRSQLSPYTNAEIADYIRAYLSPHAAHVTITRTRKPGPKAGKRESETWRTPPPTEDE